MSAHERTVNVKDDAVAYVAQTQVFYYGDDFVEVSLVPMLTWRHARRAGSWHRAGSGRMPPASLRLSVRSS